MREWKPGDVAWIDMLMYTGPAIRRMTNGWAWPSAAAEQGVGVCAEDMAVATAAEVIRFDLWPGMGSASRAAEILRLAAEDSVGERERLLTWLADQIDAPPPKLDEPQGLGAVVEDAEGRLWIRAFGDVGYHVWHSERIDTAPQQWHSVAAVKILSDGVRP